MKPHERAAGSPDRKRRRSAGEQQLVGFPFKRVYDLLTWINDGILVTKSSLAAKWGVSRSTVKRDLNFMRDRLDMPIEWDDVRKTFHFSRPCEALPFLILTRKQALVIALASRACGGLFGASFGQVFDGIVRDIAPVLGSAVSRAVASMEHVHAPQVPEGPDEFELLLPILDAIQNRRVLRFGYTKPKPQPEAPTPAQRTVHPLDIGLLDNQLRLIAHDPVRGDVRDFLLARIRGLQPLDETFERPGDYDPRKRVDGCAGSHAGGEMCEIRLALDTLAATYARERPWHHTQELAPLPDGRTEMTLRLSDLPGIRNRVMRWGKHAEVLAPIALRDEVRTELKTALERYGA
jgi:proteasome accessory factor B